jgi:nicotinamidase-related amidase
MKPALLVIDIQNDFFHNSPETARLLNSAIENINWVIPLFREKGLPVICVQQVEPENNLVPGEPGFDIPDSLKILPSDLHIHKTYRNSFNKTPLAGELAKLGVDTVFITGYCAEFCVLSTMRGAMDLDLTPIIVKDCVASDNPANITFVENIDDLITYGALRKMLE